MEIKVKQKRIDEDRFLEMRKEVLTQWPTGKEVDLEEAVAYQRSLPESKNFMKVTEKLRQEGKTIIMIEHRLKELFRIADRIIVLNYGEKIADGKAMEVMKSNAVKNAYLGSEE